MQVSIETTSELSRKMTVEVPEDRIQEQVSKRIKSLAGRVKLDGFRPGKAPQSLIVKKYGPGVRDEVLAELIQSTYYDALREVKVTPVAAPMITPELSLEGQGLKYVADFEVLPEFVLFPIEEMEVQRYVSEVTAEDLDDMVLRLREQRKTWSESDSAASVGDRVTISYEGSLDGENFTNGKVDNFPLVLGSNMLIPGFEDKLVGAIAGSHHDLELTFPEDYHAEKLKRKTAQFAVDVIKVEKSVLPEVDAEFMAHFGIENGDLEAFRVEIGSSMEREMRRALAGRTKDSVMEELRQRNLGISLPTVLVNDELNALVNAFKTEAQQRGQSFDAEAVKQSYEPVARRRVTLGLLLNRLIEMHQLKVDANKVREFINDVASTYEDSEGVVNWYYSNQDQLSKVQSLILEDQVVDLILEKGKPTDRHISFKELMQQTSLPAQA